MNDHNTVVELAAVGAKPELPEEGGAAQLTGGCIKFLVVEAVGNSGAMDRKQATRVGLCGRIVDTLQSGVDRERRSDPGPQRSHNVCLGRANVARKAQTLLGTVA